MKNFTKIIKPQSEISLRDLFQEIYQFRDLLIILAKKDFFIKYKQTVLGVSWSIFQPLVTSGIFSIIFRSFTSGKEAKLFDPEIYISVLLWQFFSKSVVEGSGSLVSSFGIISKVYFPRAILPIIPVVNACLDFITGYVFFLTMFFIFRSSFFEDIQFFNCLLIPIYIFPIAILAMCISFFLAPINARFRDISILLPFFLQTLMYLSPVLYPTFFISSTLEKVFNLNPIAAYILGARNLLMGSPISNLWVHLIFIFFPMIIILFCIKNFKSKEQSIVDVI